MNSGKRFRFLPAAVLFATLALLLCGSARTLAQAGQPLDLPCATGVTVQPIGQAMPSDANGQALVMLRLTIAPGGGFTAHTHPGTLIVSVESGALDVTQLGDMQMEVMRVAANGTPTMSEPMTMGTVTTVNTGDWFAEPEGMLHDAVNSGTVPTVVLISGLVDPNLPLVQCAEGTPAA